MSEQELLQENEKLKGRLNKAASVFKEQKATIERLTQERDQARTELAKELEKTAELETRIAEKDQEDSKFFEQVEEIQKLEDTVEDFKNQLIEQTKETNKLEETLKTERKNTKEFFAKVVDAATNLYGILVPAEKCAEDAPEKTKTVKK